LFRSGKDLKVGYRMINVKAETIAEKKTYAALIGKTHHRALLLADGYYEWQHPEDPNQPRQPFRFTVDDGALFAFAALWTRSRVEDELVESMVMLTTRPNEVAARVLNRMPVILPGPAEEELGSTASSTTRSSSCGRSTRSGWTSRRPIRRSIRWAACVKVPSFSLYLRKLQLSRSPRLALLVQRSSGSAPGQPSLVGTSRSP
jgi:hypothetical protein